MEETEWILFWFAVVAQPVVEAVEEEIVDETLPPVPCVPDEPVLESQAPDAVEVPSTIELPAPCTAKKPQEILSSFRGNYNFLQESEIDEHERKYILK